MHITFCFVTTLSVCLLYRRELEAEECSLLGIRYIRDGITEYFISFSSCFKCITYSSLGVFRESKVFIQFHIIIDPCGMLMGGF